MPTKTNLVRRTVNDNPMCDRCQSASEDQIHALWPCLELDIIWFDASAWGFHMTSTFVSTAEGRDLSLILFGLMDFSTAEIDGLICSNGLVDLVPAKSNSASSI